MNKKITIQRAWIEALLEVSERVKNVNQFDTAKDIPVAYLLGYIQSAKYLLGDTYTYDQK